MWRCPKACAPAWCRWKSSGWASRWRSPRGCGSCPPDPRVPRITTITDGINLLSGTRIVTGTVKVTMHEVADAAQFHATDRRPRCARDRELLRRPDLRSATNSISACRNASPPGPHEVLVTLGQAEIRAARDRGGVVEAGRWRRRLLTSPPHFCWRRSPRGRFVQLRAGHGRNPPARWCWKTARRCAAPLRARCCARRRIFTGAR